MNFQNTRLVLIASFVIAFKILAQDPNHYLAVTRATINGSEEKFLFAIDRANSQALILQKGKDPAFVSLGASPVLSIAATRNLGGGLIVSTIRPDRTVWLRVLAANGTWATVWTQIDGNSTFELTACNGKNGNPQLFSKRFDGFIYNTTITNGSPGAWQVLPSHLRGLMQLSCGLLNYGAGDPAMTLAGTFGSTSATYHKVVTAKKDPVTGVWGPLKNAYDKETGATTVATSRVVISSNSTVSFLSYLNYKVYTGSYSSYYDGIHAGADGTFLGLSLIRDIAGDFGGGLIAVGPDGRVYEGNTPVAGHFVKAQRIPGAAFKAASFLLPENDSQTGKPKIGTYVTGTATGSVQIPHIPFAPVIAQIPIGHPYGFTAPEMAVGDVNQDGTPDIALVMGAGYGPVVAIYDGVALLQGQSKCIAEFYGNSSLHTGAASIALGNLTGSVAPNGVKGTPYILVGAGQDSSPGVQLYVFKYNKNKFDYTKFPSGGADLYLSKSDVFPGSLSGARVASADVDGDGKDDIIAASGPGGGDIVKVYSGANDQVIRYFSAYGGFGGGVFVAANDINRDGKAEFLTGTGFGGGPHIKMWDGALPTWMPNIPFLSFFSYDTKPGGIFGGEQNYGVGGVAFSNTGTGPRIVVGSPAGMTAHMRNLDPNYADLNTSTGEQYFTYMNGVIGVTPTIETGKTYILAAVKVAGGTSYK